MIILSLIKICLVVQELFATKQSNVHKYTHTDMGINNTAYLLVMGSKNRLNN